MFLCLTIYFLQQRVRGKGGKGSEASDQPSPVSKPRRAISTPEELAYQDAVDAGFVMDRSPTSMESGSGRSGHSAMDGMATVPRTRHRQQTDPYGTMAREGIYQIPPSRLRPVNHVKRQRSQELPPKQGPQGPQGGGYAENREPIYATVKSSERTLERKDTYEDDETDEVDDNANPRRLSKPELRQFSREPTVIRLSSHLDEPEEPDYKRYPINDISDDLNHITLQMQDLTAHATDSRLPLSPPRKSHSSSSPEWPPPPEPITPISPDTPGRDVAQFDSFTLKRMLRTLPASASHSSISSNGGNRNSGNFDEAALLQQQLREQIQQQLQQQQLLEQQQAEAEAFRQQAHHQEQVALAEAQQQQLAQQQAIAQQQAQQLAQQLAQQQAQQALQEAKQAQLAQQQALQLAAQAQHQAQQQQAGLKEEQTGEADDTPPIPDRPQNYSAHEYHTFTMRPQRDTYLDTGATDTSASVKSGDSGRSSKSSKSATLPPGMFFHSSFLSFLGKSSLLQLKESISLE